jgi:hypothetical protein
MKWVLVNLGFNPIVKPDEFRPRVQRAKLSSQNFHDSAPRRSDPVGTSDLLWH